MQNDLNNINESKHDRILWIFSYPHVILYVIFLIALSVRLYQLDEESLWLDEGTSVRVARAENTLRILKPGWLDDAPPFYYLVLHYWIKVFGDSEFSLRFPSLLFSLGCISMLYQIAVLLFDKKTALLSALLITLSGYHVSFAQEARGYSLMTLEAFCSIYFFILLCRGFKWRHGAGYIVSSSLLLYTHPYGIFVILAQNLHLVIRALIKIDSAGIVWKQWILLQMILLVSFLPWLGVIISKIIRIQTSGLLWDPSLFDIPGALKTFSGDSAYVGVFFIVLATCAIIRWKGNQAHTKNGLPGVGDTKWYRNLKIAHFEQTCLLSVWLWTPIILPFIISKVSTPILMSRYLIAASGAFYILVARGIVSLNRKSVTIISIIVILGWYPLEILSDYTTLNKEPWREAVPLVEGEAMAGDAVVINANYCFPTVYEYYAARNDLDVLPFPDKGKVVTEADIISFEPIRNQHERIWLILSHQSDEIDLLQESLLETHWIVEHWQYYRIEVFFYQKNDI